MQKRSNRIDPSIPLKDEEDGQEFFDAVFASVDLPPEILDAVEKLSYSQAAELYRAIRR